MRSQTYLALHVLFFPPNVFYLSIHVCASLPGKFGAFLASIPLSIVAAIYCVLFSFVGMCVIYILCGQMH